jgi:hypothetical protein
MNLLNRTAQLIIGSFSLSLVATTLGQNQSPPIASYDSQTNTFHLDWQSTRKRTFFPQVSPDLSFWDYAGAIHFGPGQHGGMFQANAPRAFFRLAFSDLPVASESEAETADFDLDGLTNKRELQAENTNPLNPDSDSDGLPDGWEVAHQTSPLDDGSIDPQNGPDGLFNAASGSSGSGSFASFSATTNRDAFDAGVRAHPAATLSDKDGDGIPDVKDAGPLSACIDWETDNSWPRFIYSQVPGHNLSFHGTIIGCNGKGDVLASKAVLVDGVWNYLAQIQTGSANYLPLKVQVGPRQHKAYAKFQPLPSSISNDGKIVGRGTVAFESITEEDTPGHFVTYSLPDTSFAFIWDSYANTPRLFAHAPQSVLTGQYWDESAQISDDGAVVIKRRAINTANTNQHRFIRYAPSGSVELTGGYPVWLPAAIGPSGFQAFNEGSSNAYSWLPGLGAPQSLLAEATFSTPNPRSTYSPSVEPAFIGSKPGTEGGFALNFWGKAMIRHENRWHEATELGDATHLTTDGIAFQARTPNAVQVWKGNKARSLVSSVINKSFTSLYAYPRRSTTDGRVLVNFFGSGNQFGDGFLIPADVASLDRYVQVGIPIEAVNNLGGIEQFAIRFKSASGSEIHGLVNNTLSTAHVHNSEEQMLDDDEIASYGGGLDPKCYNDDHQDSAIWQDGNTLKIATTFNEAGPIQIEFVSGESVIATIDYTLTPLSDFSSLIDTLDQTLGEISYGSGPPGGTLNASQTQFGGFGFLNMARRNLVTKCMRAVYTSVKQHVVEGVAKVTAEATQALKIAAIGGEGFVRGLWAGVKDDYNGLVDGVQLFGSLITNPIETAASFHRGFQELLSLSMEELSQIPRTLVKQFLAEATEEIAWAGPPNNFDLAVYTVAYTTGFITEKVGLVIITGGFSAAAQGLAQGANFAVKFTSIISKIRVGDRLLETVTILTDKVKALGAMKAKTFRQMSQYVDDKAGLAALRQHLEIRMRPCTP